MAPFKVTFNGAGSVESILTKANQTAAEEFGLKAISEPKLKEIINAIDSLRDPEAKPFQNEAGQELVLSGATFREAQGSMSVIFDYSPVVQ